MNDQPQKLTTRILGYICLFVLGAFLLHLGVNWLKEIWWILLILAAVAAVGLFLYRMWQQNRYP